MVPTLRFSFPLASNTQIEFNYLNRSWFQSQSFSKRAVGRFPPSALRGMAEEDPCAECQGEGPWASLSLGMERKTGGPRTPGEQEAAIEPGTCMLPR